MTTTANPHATTIGRMNRGSGRRNGPTFHVDAAISSRRSARYAAKKMASAILANSPGWKLIGPTLTQMRAPLIVWPMPGTSGRRSRNAPAVNSSHL